MKKEKTYSFTVTGAAATILVDAYCDINDHVYAVIAYVFLGEVKPENYFEGTILKCPRPMNLRNHNGILGFVGPNCMTCDELIRELCVFMGKYVSLDDIKACAEENGMSLLNEAHYQGLVGHVAWKKPEPKRKFRI